MICRKCDGCMDSGIALRERPAISTDSPHSFPSGISDIVPVKKCQDCGHSVFFPDKSTKP